jgi:protein tyrosine/serine phosphatase
MASAAQLLEKDVKTVINLELLHDDKGTFTAARPNLNIEYTLNYYSLPDWEPLAVTSKKIIDRRVEDFIAITRIAPWPIFVHCRSGQNRTGMMIAALHIFKGMPIEQAIDDMLSYGGLWSHQNIAYLRTLTPKKRAKMEQNIVLNMRNIKPNSILSCSRIGCFDPEVY